MVVEKPDIVLSINRNTEDFRHAVSRITVYVDKRVNPSLQFVFSPMHIFCLHCEDFAMPAIMIRNISSIYV